MSEVGSVDEAEWGGSGYFAVLREQGRLRREVVTATRKSMRGRPPAEIADELERALLAEGLVHPPEEIQLWTGVIASQRRPVLEFARMGVQALTTRRAPAGLKLKRRRLAGGRWLPVRVAPRQAWAYAAMAHYHEAFQRMSAFGAASPSARLVETRHLPDGGSPVAVLLGVSFVGTVDSAMPGLLAEVRAAGAEGAQLNASARIERAGPGWTLSVEVPAQPG
jgi:hypothetical protein